MTAPARELFGTPWCPHTADMRAHLELDGEPFVEHDVDADPDALARMLTLTGGRRTVPVFVEGGVVREIGWRGRGCTVA